MPGLTVALCEQTFGQALQSARDMVEVWLLSYWTYLCIKNGPATIEQSWSQVFASEEGILPRTTALYMSKHIASSLLPIVLEDIPMVHFSYIYHGALLSPAAYTTELTNRAYSIYVDALPRIHETGCIQLRINTASLGPATNRVQAHELREFLSNLAHTADRQAPTNVRIAVEFVVAEEQASAITPLLAETGWHVQAPGANSSFAASSAETARFLPQNERLRAFIHTTGKQAPQPMSLT